MPSSYKHNPKIYYIFICSLAMLFIVPFVFGIVYNKNLAIIQSITSIILIAIIPILLELIPKIKTSIYLLIIFFINAYIGCFFEVYDLYYKITWFDDIQHILNPTLISLAVYSLVLIIFNDANNYKLRYVLIMIAICMCVVAMWEIFEFTIDAIFGTNMQKIIPDDFNNGYHTNLPLEGTNEDIGNFYKNKYNYALVDTMWDILYSFFGTIIAATSIIVLKFFKKYYFNYCLVKI